MRTMTCTQKPSPGTMALAQPWGSKPNLGNAHITAHPSTCLPWMLGTLRFHLPCPAGEIRHLRLKNSEMAT